MEHQEDGCPRALFVDDLVSEAQEWLDAGDQIVIGIDANQSLTSRTYLERELARIGIYNAVTHGMGSRHLPLGILEALLLTPSSVVVHFWAVNAGIYQQPTGLIIGQCGLIFPLHLHWVIPAHHWFDQVFDVYK
jgi:hypothetical protein